VSGAADRTGAPAGASADGPRRVAAAALVRLAPALVVAAVLIGWEAAVRIGEVPHYLVPAPSLVAETLWRDLPSLLPSLWFTLKITVGALVLAVAGGVLLAALFALSRPLETALFPLAIVLQVTPIVAIAPLILIYVESTTAALLICAFIVAFFPILANTVVGLRSADAGLRDLFTLYGASRWQRLRLLLVPSALPYFLAGLRIAGGLALIGAVVAEFAAGAAGRETGLASRILEASFRTEIPRMFAALALGSVSGVWPFPAVLPHSWTLDAWQAVVASGGTLGHTLTLALAAAGAALVWSVVWLEWAPLAWDRAARPLLYATLALPALLWVPGLYPWVLRAGGEGRWAGVWIAHALAALPYVLVALSPAYLGFDARYAQVAASLGQGRARFLLRVKWPLLRRALAASWAVGFAVSVAQYLPTLYLGAGRVNTVTTEAVALASGGHRSLAGAYAALQWFLPALGFALAAWLGRARRFGAGHA